MKNFPNAFFGSASKPPPDWRGSEDFDPDDDDMDETPPDVVSMLGFDPKEFDDETDEEWHPFIEFGLDEANFKESEHPRDADGKFAPYQHSISGEVGKKMKTNLKTLEFKKAAKTSSGKFKYENPLGAVIVIEPPPEKGAWSAKWTLYPGPNTKEPIKGSGNKSLSDAIEQYAKWNDLNKSKSGTPKQEAPKQAEEPKKSQQASSAIDLMNNKGFNFNQSKEYWTKGEAKVKFGPEKKWLSVSPGHVTKEGVGFADLEKLLNGEIPPSAKSAKTANIDYWPNPAPESKPAQQQQQPQQNKQDLEKLAKEQKEKKNAYAKSQLKGKVPDHDVGNFLEVVATMSDSPDYVLNYAKKGMAAAKAKYNVDLLPSEAAALVAYTGSYSSHANKPALSNQMTPAQYIYHKSIKNALAKLPQNELKETKRGVTLKPEQIDKYVPGYVRHEPNFSSSNAEGWQGNVKMHFKGTSGKNVAFLSLNPSENETLWPPGYFKVTKKEESGGKTHIYMEEM